jgi:formyl-CoA transferase
MVVRIGSYTGTASPIKLSRTPARYALAPPEFGQHTSEIMASANAKNATESPAEELDVPAEAARRRDFGERDAE